MKSMAATFPSQYTLRVAHMLQDLGANDSISTSGRYGDKTYVRDDVRGNDKINIDAQPAQARARRRTESASPMPPLTSQIKH